MGDAAHTFASLRSQGPHVSSSLCLLKKSGHFQGNDFELSNVLNFSSFETVCSNLPNLKELPVTTQFAESREQQVFDGALTQHGNQFAD